LLFDAEINHNMLCQFWWNFIH